MTNNDSLHTLLINCRNNQELYIKNKWQVAYFTFLLYVAIIYAFNLIGSGHLIFVLLELDRAIIRHQNTAEKIYDSIPLMGKFVVKRHTTKRLHAVSITLIACVFIGMLISVAVLFSMYSEKNKHFLQRIEKLEKERDQCFNTLEQIKIDNTMDQKINNINDQLSKRIDQLKARIGEIKTTVQLPKNAKSKGK